MSEKRKSALSITSLRDYLVQVSLIILSLLIAFGVDRCNQGVKEDRKLEAYLSAIYQELQDEQASTAMNLADCEADIEDLTEGAVSLASADKFQQAQAIGRIGRVFTRGVFRSFSPTSFDLMTSSGDGLLIEDLALRRSLASVIAFRNNYVKADLIRHDELTLQAIGEVAEYIDLGCVRATEPANFTSCVTNPQKMASESRSDLAKLTRHSELRAFHLELYTQHLAEVVPLVKAALE